MQYTYFVSFVCQTPDGSLSFGNCELTLDEELNSIEQINELQSQSVLGKVNFNYVILNFQLIRKKQPGIINL